MWKWMNDRIPGLMNDNKDNHGHGHGHGTSSTSREISSHKGGESDLGDDLVFGDFS